MELRTFTVLFHTLEMALPLRDADRPQPELCERVRFELLYNTETGTYFDPEMGTEFASWLAHRRPGYVYELMMRLRAAHR